MTNHVSLKFGTAVIYKLQLYNQLSNFFDDTLQSNLTKNSTTVAKLLADSSKGNNAIFDVSNTTKRANSPLQGKTYFWLGSSVTIGAASGNQSMADFVAKRNGSVCVKDAISGTKLRHEDNNSYVDRLLNFNTDTPIDGFICQLSTNDRSDSSKFGSVSATQFSGFDVNTTYGTIEYIISYVYQNWHCPIYFYSGSYFSDAGTAYDGNYKTMNDTLKQIAKKWTDNGVYVKVIDLFNTFDSEYILGLGDTYNLYMNDAIHPYKSGYRHWWTPEFEKAFLHDLGYQE